MWITIHYDRVILIIKLVYAYSYTCRHTNQEERKEKEEIIKQIIKIFT